MRKLHRHTRTAIAMAALLGCVATAQAQATLAGWAVMPANTFSDGLTSGLFAGAGNGGNALPLIDKQPVQGFSAVLPGPSTGSYLVMPDNGFGTQGNSADTLLRMYAVRPDFRTASGGSGTVSAANFSTGAALPAFNADSRIALADPAQRVGFNIQAGYTHYYNNAANPLVDTTQLATRRLLASRAVAGL